MKILLEGRPGIGKTTVILGLVRHLRQAGVPLQGFYTREIRQSGRRVGFALKTLDGRQGVLAHVELPGPPRVGKYGVDLQALERLAVPSLQGGPEVVVLIDEMGKMELASRAFREAVEAVFAGDRRLVATVHLYRHPLTDRLKGRADVALIRVTVENRDRLSEELARSVGGTGYLAGKANNHAG